MSDVKVGQYLVLARHFEKDENEKFHMTKPVKSEHAQIMAVVHKAAGKFRFEEEYNATQVYACIPLYYDRDTKEYFMFDTEKNKLTGINFFEDGVTLPIG